MNKPLYQVIDIFSKEVVMTDTSVAIALQLKVSKRTILHAQQHDRRVKGRYKITNTGESIDLHPLHEIENFKQTEEFTFQTEKLLMRKKKKVVTSTVLPKRRNGQSEQRKERIEETAGLREATFKETVLNAQNYVVTNTYFKNKKGVFLLKTFAHGKKEEFSHLITH